MPLHEVDTVWAYTLPFGQHFGESYQILAGTLNQDGGSLTDPHLLIHVACDPARKRGRLLHPDVKIGGISIFRGKLSRTNNRPYPNVIEELPHDDAEDDTDSTPTNASILPPLPANVVDLPYIEVLDNMEATLSPPSPVPISVTNSTTTDSTIPSQADGTSVHTSEQGADWPSTVTASLDTHEADWVLNQVDNWTQMDPLANQLLDALLQEPTEDSVLNQQHPNAVACLILVRCYQSVVRAKPYPVAVSDTLPHILFPLGKYSPDTHWRHFPQLRAVFDSGAGVSLGYLPFFTDLHDKHPHLVHKFELIDPTIFSEIFVGNIDKNCDAASCTHYIEIYTPFMDQGQSVTIRLALSPVLSVNALLGLPFMLKAKMTPNFSDGYVYSASFQATFMLEYSSPLLQETLPQQDGQQTKVFLTSQPNDSTRSPSIVLDPNDSRATAK